MSVVLFIQFLVALQQQLVLLAIDSRWRGQYLFNLTRVNASSSRDWWTLLKELTAGVVYLGSVPILVLQKTVYFSHQWHPVKSVEFVILESYAEKGLDFWNFFNWVLEVGLIVLTLKHVDAFYSAERRLCDASDVPVLVHLSLAQVALVVVANTHHVIWIDFCNHIADNPGKLQLFLKCIQRSIVVFQLNVAERDLFEWVKFEFRPFLLIRVSRIQ